MALFSLVLAALVTFASASVTVRKTGSAPTGYEVDFVLANTPASSVTIAGGLRPFTDQFHTSPQYSANYDPHDYRAGDFFVQLPASTSAEYWPYNMTESGDGTWTYTAPFPSGTYQYAFLVDCPTQNFNCTTTSDRDNPPFSNVPGDQLQSTFQVPFDARFQTYPALDLNFDYALPVAASASGSIQHVNYTSPGSTHPAPDVHDFVLYLPAGYEANSQNTTYPLLYLSHGGGGNASDWQNLARASNILDNLILAGHIEPTVVVMPNFYDLGNTSGSTGAVGIAGSPAPQDVRLNYEQYLYPYIEATYAVSRDPARRAFAGLSLGSLLTYEMYVNATEYFGYFGLFSGARGPGAAAGEYVSNVTLAANPALAEVGVFLSFGLFDIAFDDTRAFQAALDALDIGHLQRVVPWGSHYWNTWQDSLWNFGVTSLWKEKPFTRDSAR